MVGTYNVLNALAAIAIAIEMEIADETIRSAPGGDRRVKRRFTTTGEVAGITVVDDYATIPSRSRPCSAPRGPVVAAMS